MLPTRLADAMLLARDMYPEIFETVTIEGNDVYADVPFVDLDRVKEAVGELGPEESKRNEVQEMIRGLKAIAQKAEVERGPAPPQGELGDLKKNEKACFTYFEPATSESNPGNPNYHPGMPTRNIDVQINVHLIHQFQ
jgi:hypothetical protein